MTLFVSIVVLVSVIVVAFQFLERIVEFDNSLNTRSFVVWAIQGLLFPSLVWLAFNVGIGSILLPFMPQVQAAQAAVLANVAAGVVSPGSWWPQAILVIGWGWMVIASYWGALTFAWWCVLLWHNNPESRKDFMPIVSMWSLTCLPFSVVIVYVCGWSGLGLAAGLWLVAMLYGMLATEPKRMHLPACYSSAIAYMKFGKYTEAEMAVLNELEKCEDDFEGWMMLADLYANRFHDLKEAERTIRDVCNQPNITASHVSVALHKLSEWKLKLSDDPVGARKALEEIVRRFPETHMAHMATLRLNQIPSSVEKWKQREARIISLPAHKGLLYAITDIREQDAEKLAIALEEKLSASPDDSALRTLLASVLAERLERVDDGLKQLEFTFMLPNLPPHTRAEILTLMADWLVRFKRDTHRGRQLLERVIKDYPQTTIAFEARQRLVQLDV